MIRIGVRELNQHTSRYLNKVKAGDTVEVTERGHLIARLVPAGAGTDLLDSLVASGEVEPPAVDPSSLAAPGEGRPDGIDVAAELVASRERERW